MLRKCRKCAGPMPAETKQRMCNLCLPPKALPEKQYYKQDWEVLRTYTEGEFTVKVLETSEQGESFDTPYSKLARPSAAQAQTIFR